MPEIEGFTEPALFGVLRDDRGLKCDVVCDEVGRHIERRQFVPPREQCFKEFFAECAVFYHLPQPAAHLARGQGRKKAGIGKHCLGLVERPHEVLDAQKVDGRLSAHRGIDLRQKGGRHLEAGDAAHIERRRKAADVPDDAAADHHEAARAVELLLCHRLQKREQRLLRLVFLARGHGEHGHVAQHFADARSPQPFDVAVGKDQPLRIARKKAREFLFKRPLAAEDGAF